MQVLKNCEGVSSIGTQLSFLQTLFFNGDQTIYLKPNQSMESLPAQLRYKNQYQPQFFQQVFNTIIPSKLITLFTCFTRL